MEAVTQTSKILQRDACLETCVSSFLVTLLIYWPSNDSPDLLTPYAQHFIACYELLKWLAGQKPIFLFTYFYLECAKKCLATFLSSQHDVNINVFINFSLAATDALSYYNTRIFSFVHSFTPASIIPSSFISRKKHHWAKENCFKLQFSLIF